MESRELVRTSLAFAGPERIPMALPAPYPNDFVRGGGAAPDPQHKGTGWYRAGDAWERIDTWGNTWQRLEAFSKGEVTRGALQNWDDLDRYVFPTYNDPAQYAGARTRFAAAPDKYRIGGLPGFPFNIARYLRRLDFFLEDLVLEPKLAISLLDRITELLEDMINGMADAGADAISFPEDWGTQDRLMISPTMWRQIFRPRFERLCGLAHKRGLAVFMHSCGYIYEIIGDLIEAGIDALNFDQPEIHGVDNLARNFGGKVHFWCPVDIQKTLQTGDAKTVEAAARNLVDKRGCFGGGFIAGYYGDNSVIGVDPKIQDVACQAFVKYGTFRPSNG